MTNENQATESEVYTALQPDVRKIGLADLRDALSKGVADFEAMPTHLVFLCIIYPILTLLMARVAGGYDVLPLVFPLLAGFTLIGPLAACGMYELSKRRERGEDISRWHAFNIRKSPAKMSIASLGIVQLAVYLVWLGVANVIYNQVFGDFVPTSVGEFIGRVFGTETGRTLIVVGSGVGFIFAAVVLSVSAISFPLVLDRDVGAVSAAFTSIRVTLANPIIMAIWGLIVAVTLALGALPLFFGLAVVMPVLGHATWHLYRKVVQW